MFYNYGHLLGKADVAMIFRYIWAVFGLFSLRLWVHDVIRDLVTQAGEWQKSKQMMGLPSPSLRPLGAFLQFILSRKTEGLDHLDCSFGFKQKRRNFWLKEALGSRNVSSKSFTNYIAVSTSFELPSPSLFLSPQHLGQVPCKDSKRCCLSDSNSLLKCHI